MEDISGEHWHKQFTDLPDFTRLETSQIQRKEINKNPLRVARKRQIKRSMCFSFRKWLAMWWCSCWLGTRQQVQLSATPHTSWPPTLMYSGDFRRSWTRNYQGYVTKFSITSREFSYFLLSQVKLTTKPDICSICQLSKCHSILGSPRISESVTTTVPGHGLQRSP